MIWMGSDPEEAVGAHADWSAFIDAVEEFVGTFLIALGDDEAFRGRSQSQKMIWKAYKRTWCDMFPHGDLNGSA